MADRFSNRQGQRAAARGRSFDPDEPVAGFYSTRLAKGCCPVALCFWLGQPLDPDTGDLMDRSPRWMCLLNGWQLVEVSRFWPACARNPISREEHDRLCRRSQTLDPLDPYFDPLRPLDHRNAKPPF